MVTAELSHEFTFNFIQTSQERNICEMLKALLAVYSVIESY